MSIEGKNISVRTILIVFALFSVATLSFIFYKESNNDTSDVLGISTVGVLDPAFLYPITPTESTYPTALAVQTDDKIYIGTWKLSTAIQWQLHRINIDGTIDNSFNVGIGQDANDVTHITPLANGQMYVSGTFNKWNNSFNYRTFVRLNGDGTLDTSFRAGLTDGVDTHLVQPNGYVIAGGWFRWRVDTIAAGDPLTAQALHSTPTPYGLMRFDQDGNVDTTFNTGTGVNGPFTGMVEALALQPDGMVLVGGKVSSYNGTPVHGIFRLSTTGGLDTSFNNSGSGFPDGQEVRKIIVQPDNKILVLGWFSSYNGVNRFGLLRLLSDGTLDTGFYPIQSTDNGALLETMALLPNGMIIVGGHFSAINGVPQGKIARFYSDGTLDTEFNGCQTGFTGGRNTWGYPQVGYINSLALSNDGLSLYAAGDFQFYNGTSREYIVKLNNIMGLTNVSYCDPSPTPSPSPSAVIMTTTLLPSASNSPPPIQTTVIVPPNSTPTPSPTPSSSPVPTTTTNITPLPTTLISTTVGIPTVTPSTSIPIVTTVIVPTTPIVLPTSYVPSITPTDIISRCPAVFVSAEISTSVAKPGERVTITWKTQQAQSVRLNTIPKLLPPEGHLTFFPTESGTLSLIADTGYCIARKDFQLLVTETPPWITTGGSGLILLIIETAVVPISGVILPQMMQSISSISPFSLQGNIFYAIADVITRRRKKYAGIVYDAANKKPLARVVLRLIDSHSNEVRDTTVSDSLGIFRFNALKGSYQLQATREGYTFPTRVITDTSDGGYGNIYSGGDISITNDHENILLSVPLDPINQDQDKAKSKLASILRAILDILSLGLFVWGFSYSFYAQYLYPHPYNQLVLYIYASYALLKAYLLYSKPRTTGKVTKNGKPLSGIEIGLFDKEFDTLLLRTFTSHKGEYSFIVGPGTYILKIMDRAVGKFSKTIIVAKNVDIPQYIKVNIKLP